MAILPYIEQGALYKQFDLDKSWDDPHNKKLIAKMPKLYVVPGVEAKEGMAHYRTLVGPGTVLEPLKGLDGKLIGRIRLPGQDRLIDCGHQKPGWPGLSAFVQTAEFQVDFFTRGIVFLVRLDGQPQPSRRPADRYSRSARCGAASRACAPRRSCWPFRGLRGRVESSIKSMRYTSNGQTSVPSSTPTHPQRSRT